MIKHCAAKRTQVLDIEREVALAGRFGRR